MRLLYEVYNDLDGSPRENRASEGDEEYSHQMRAAHSSEERSPMLINTHDHPLR
jgi:hypothetical protein